ncbi:hypothetical protein JNW90_01355 [Micromonospora sp. STR1s_5]|nr:hypothetical protein [Micromonospora sp. STR1s_5]
MIAVDLSQALLIARYAVVGKAFREELHPRDGHGRFAQKPGSGSTAADVAGRDAGPARPGPAERGGMRDARRFATDDDAIDWAVENLEQPDLTDEERESVFDYTGDHYQEMNDALRELDKDGTRPDHWTMDRIEAVRSAIAKSPAPEPFVVFRGSPPKILESMIGKLGEPDDDERLQRLVGRTFHVPTFHSTSVGAKAYFEYNPVQWMIKIPEGQPALWVEGDLTQNEGEREVLLPDDTRRVIHGIYRNPANAKQLFVELEVVPGDWEPGEDWVPQPFGDAYAGYLKSE